MKRSLKLFTLLGTAVVDREKIIYKLVDNSVSVELNPNIEDNVILFVIISLISLALQ